MFFVSIITSRLYIPSQHIHHTCCVYRGHVEAGVDSYSTGRVPTGEDYETMRKKSPVAHLDKVITPTMIMLGEDDRRVPPSQGMEFYKALLAKGTKAK